MQHSILLFTGADKRDQNENIHFNFEIDALTRGNDKLALHMHDRSCLEELFFRFEKKQKTVYEQQKLSTFRFKSTNDIYILVLKTFSMDPSKYKRR